MTARLRAERATRILPKVAPMRCLSLIAFAALACGVSNAEAQSCCAQPTVAYSPVVAPAPAVVQTTTVRDGWYPGKYLTDFTRGLFGYNRTTYTTAYAPTPYTAGYAPTPYVASYAPSYQTAYRPVYPASYGPVTYAPAPVVRSVSRPVVLSPVVSAAPCGGCGGFSACDSCSGVSQAAYAAPSSGCSSCASSVPYEAPLSTGTPSYSFPEERPSLAPDADVPATREQSIRQRPAEIDAFPDDFDDEFPSADPVEANPSAATDYWRTPPLFAPPTNRVTRNTHPAPVRNAVYRRPVDVEPTAYRPAAEPRTKVHRLSADGWAAAE